MDTLDYKELLESLGDPFFFVDGKGIISYANPSAREAFAFLGQVEGLPLAGLLKDPGLAEALDRVLKEKRAIRGYPLKVAGAGGNHHFLVSFYPVEKEGSFQGIELLFRDITHWKVLEEKERHTQNLSLVEEVLSKAFHQLNGPLTGLKGAAQLLEEGEGDLLEYARFIRREVLRLQQLVREAINFSRPLVLDLVETNIHRVLEEVLNSFRYQAQSQDVEVERLYDPGIPSLMADPFRLYQVFSNLVKNALEAMSGGGTLRVRTGISWDKQLMPNMDTLLVSIEDTGPGVAPRIREQLFSPFTTSKSDGMGLGLSIAYKIVRSHQGHLLYRREGDWTVFEVILPMRRCDEHPGD